MALVNPLVLDMGILTVLPVNKAMRSYTLLHVSGITGAGNIGLTLPAGHAISGCVCRHTGTATYQSYATNLRIDSLTGAVAFGISGRMYKGVYQSYHASASYTGVIDTTSDHLLYWEGTIVSGLIVEFYLYLTKAL